eukprot:930790-Prymnesium_polylepis.1
MLRASEACAAPALGFGLRGVFDARRAAPAAFGLCAHCVFRDSAECALRFPRLQSTWHVRSRIGARRPLSPLRRVDSGPFLQHSTRTRSGRALPAVDSSSWLRPPHRKGQKILQGTNPDRLTNRAH